MEKLYTVEDVATMTGLTSRTIRTYIKEGVLTGKKIGVQWRFTDEDINQLFKDQDLTKDSIEESNDEVLLPFREFLHRTDLSTSKACLMWDCKVNNIFDLEHTCLSLLSDFNDDIEDEKISFSYQYFESTSMARFLLNGQPDLIFRMIQMIRSEL